MGGTCFCGAPSRSRCVSCATRYCSRACQLLAWPEHRAQCPKVYVDERARELRASRKILAGETILENEEPFIITSVVVDIRQHDRLYNSRPAWQLAEIAIRSGLELGPAPDPGSWEDADTRVLRRITEAYGATEADVRRAYAACVEGNSVARVTCVRSTGGPSGPSGCVQLPVQYGMFHKASFVCYDNSSGNAIATIGTDSPRITLLATANIRRGDKIKVNDTESRARQALVHRDEVCTFRRP